MPTYEYACRSCGEHLEVVQSFKDDPLTTCPSCEGQLKKVFSAAGIIFKGSGWHIKDYASTSGGSSGAPASTSDTSSSSSDSKGASSSSSKDSGSSSSGSSSGSSSTAESA
jgi:putative FmdB family regulatory protein